LYSAHELIADTHSAAEAVVYDFFAMSASTGPLNTLKSPSCSSSVS
jgi:hypothetical protein